MTAAAHFAPLAPDRPADEVERELLARWEEEDLFRQTLERNADGPPFVFFEGPPTANGRPGIHHVFARTIKDLFCRHRAMKGFRVSRKAGWDTHGLPVEIEVEKQLGISGKQQIEALGVAEFNRLCRESVFKYRSDWERLSARIGYWLDYEHPYVTYSNEYVESVWWALKTLHDRGLLYRGHKILPYCSRCGTALSSHEVAQGYEEVEDPSVYVALELTGERRATGSAADSGLDHDTMDARVQRGAGGQAGSRIRRGAASRAGEGSENTHSRRSPLARGARRGLRPALGNRRSPVRAGPRGASLSATVRLGRVSRGIGARSHRGRRVRVGGGRERRGPHVARVRSRRLRGREAPQPRVPAAGGPARQVSRFDAGRRRVVREGRGSAAHRRTETARRVVARQPRVAPVPALLALRHAAHLLRAHVVVRPHDRGARRDAGAQCAGRLLPPSVGDGRFNTWLTTNVDWAISRDRFWGTPLPVWVCDADDAHVDAVGGFAELSERAGGPLPRDFDPHKPHVDSYTWRCARAGCRGTMRRVSEVIDAWFDSGSMSFAQWHYPFENKERMSVEYPADFIAEGVDQTRGWFYSLLAIATGLGDALPNNGGSGEGGADSGPTSRGSDGAGPAWDITTGSWSVPGEASPSRVASARPRAAPYGAVVVNDMVRDAQGVKMAKSRGNTIDPWEVIGRHGVDAVRLFLVASSDVWLPRNFDERALSEQSGRFLRTFKNVYSGIFAQYANFGWAPSHADPPVAARPVLDRWMLSRLARLERLVDAALDDYDATTAARAIIEFVDDDLANWYIRRSRERFYDTETDDNRAAFATLHEVLVSTCRLLAPIAPFVSDWMHRELAGESVHLAPFVSNRADHADATLDVAMHAIRELARLGRAAREEVGIKVRQPLARMVCVAPNVSESALEPLISLLRAELNVKVVEFASSGDALVTLEARPNFRSLGKKFGKRTPLAAQAVAAFDGGRLRDFVHGTPLVVSVEGESHELSAEDVTIVRRASGSLVVQEDGGFFAAIDPSVTPELKQEGHAREVISRVQRMRKEAGFAVSDRIVLTVGGGAEVRAVVEAHGDWIAAEVLAAELVLLDDPGSGAHEMLAVDLDGTTAYLAITRK